MKISVLAITLVLMFTLAGCGNSTVDLFARQQNRAAEASGSPFRWKAESIRDGTAMTRVMIDLPLGSTKAGDTLRKDILSQIKKVELSQRRGAPEVEEVRLLPDAREVWVLKNKTEGVAYIVTMKPSPQGGSSFSIAGPERFQRGG